MNITEIVQTNASETEGKYFFLVHKKGFQSARKQVQKYLPGIYKKYLTKEERERRPQTPNLPNNMRIPPSIETLNRKLTQLANGIDTDKGTREDPTFEIDIDINNKGDDEKVITTKKQKLTYKEALHHKTYYENNHTEQQEQRPPPTPQNETTWVRLDERGIRNQINEIIMREVNNILPAMLKEKGDTSAMKEDLDMKIVKKTEELSKEATAHRNETRKLFTTMQKWMDEQRERANNQKREVDGLKEEARSTEKELKEQIDDMTMTMETIEKKAEINQRELAMQIDTRLDQERRKQDEHR